MYISGLNGFKCPLYWHKEAVNGWWTRGELWQLTLAKKTQPELANSSYSEKKTTRFYSFRFTHSQLMSQSLKSDNNQPWTQSFIVASHKKWMIYPHRSRLRSFLHSCSCWEWEGPVSRIRSPQFCLFKTTELLRALNYVTTLKRDLNTK